ncbi:MAG: hypothetical protein ACYCZX_01380 [Rhodospirillaceae bacterium]
MSRNVIPFPRGLQPPETSSRCIAPPAEGPGIFTAHSGRPIWWRDAQGVLHACEGAEFRPGVIVYWTLCQRDIACDNVFHPRPQQRLTCDGCRAVIRERSARDRRDAAPNPPRPH